ncbi:MAG: hypothetical protein IJT12_02630, partial [Paludibacteraceae bacterium]|nr:hypothetical protein [Paludibacteraceae bacterium]
MRSGLNRYRPDTHYVSLTHNHTILFVLSVLYARACYYYGYLLRQHGNQVAAMQAFIASTHAPYIQRVIPLPWFSNYHILGRIYSNMGTMC